MQALSYYTATIHTPTATKYATFSGLSEVYTYLDTIGPYLYADIRCNGTLIHHKRGPSVPTCAPTCAPAFFLRRWLERVVAWVKRLRNG